MSLTYDFGSGPVPAHRHANGGGWVADAATVAAGVWVGPLASVAGGTIWGGTIKGGAHIVRTEDLLVIGPLGSRDDLLTVYPDKDGAPVVATGCFVGTPDEFLAAVVARHAATAHADEYTTAVSFALGLWDARRTRLAKDGGR